MLRITAGMCKVCDDWLNILKKQTNQEENIEKMQTPFLKRKYFDKGHTFMSAYASHYRVEKAMKEKRRLYNFKDFGECISKNGV